MKKVLIPCQTHDAVFYSTALQHAGITPIVSDRIENENDYDGLLLPGGGDIAPIFYHKKNRGSQNICISEDIIQLLLFQRFLEQKKPILGICKGMQLINVALGGSLVQDLPTGRFHAYHNGDRYHTTKALSGSHLHSVYGKDCITNSAHHQAINKLGTGLCIAQYAFDGVIEGIEHTSLPIIGVQWHPERMIASNSVQVHPARNYVNHTFENPADGSKLFSYFSSLF